MAKRKIKHPRRMSGPSKAQLHLDLARQRLHIQTLTLERDQENTEQELKLLCLETVIAKAARTFRAYAENYRGKIRGRDVTFNVRADAMDKALTNDMLASMCEEALKP